MAAGARAYLLDEEIGRGLLVPLVRHLDGAPRQADAGAAAGAPPASRRLLHDLGNLLAVVSGESEMLAARADPKDPLSADIKSLHETINESVRTFRLFMASRKEQGSEVRPDAEG